MLRVENLQLRLSNRDIFDIPHFTLPQGQVTALVGPNGAGKSSLLLTLALLQPPTQGSIFFDGHRVSSQHLLATRRRMAVVFQEPLLLDSTVSGNLLTALRIRGVSRREAARRTDLWLDRFGVRHLARQSAHTLSGGEAQRTSLARALALQPEVLFLDEPFASLDYPTRTALLGELGSILKEMKITTLLVTHDFSEIPALAQTVAVLYQGRIVKNGTVTEIFGQACLDRWAWVPWESAVDKS
jgi:tungstate transport system ATP-binding protein